MTSLPRVIFIVGPTASGKTELAIQSYERFHTPVINGDSVQVYVGVDIGTAKPTPAELGRAPHELLSFVPPGETYTAGIFAEDVKRVIESKNLEAIGVNQAPPPGFVVVGGSGFYLQALEKGMFVLPEVSTDVRERLNQEMELGGRERLWEELAVVDSAYAEKISKGDTYRLLRALEIWRGLGQRMTDLNQQFAQRDQVSWCRSLKIGLTMSREVLRKRVRARVEKMLERGLIAEVEMWRARGFSQWSPLKSVGYKEVQSFLDGELTYDEMVDRMVISTMQLAKRQMTWFRRDPEIQWFDSLQGYDAALLAMQNFLNSI